MKDNTNVADFIQNLNAGNFEQLVGQLLTDVASGVIDHEKKGSVTITFSLDKMGDSTQVMVNHKVMAKIPTKTGEVTETSTTKTPMSVNPGGKVTLFPEYQAQIFD